MGLAARRRRASQRGQSMVEFALLAPMLFLIVMAIVDLGRGVFYYNVISNAAREGAREAILRWNQCQNTAPCPGAKLTGVSTIIGVEPKLAQAGAGVLKFQFTDGGFNPASPGTAPACTPQPNGGCVWIFESGDVNGGACAPGGGPGPLDTYTLCNFNPSKSSGHNDVVVEVEYRFQPLTPLVGTFFSGGATNFWAKSEMRTEY